MSDDVEVTVKLTAEAVRLLRENKWEGHHDALRDKVRAALLAQHPEDTNPALVVRDDGIHLLSETLAQIEKDKALQAKVWIEERSKPARVIEAWVEPDELYDPCPVGLIECYLEDPGDVSVRVEIHIPEQTP